MADTELLNKVIAMSLDAGKAIMEIYQEEDLGIEVKADASPLTLADQKSHDVLVAALELVDSSPILSEEGASIPWSTRQRWQRYWLIDPLDGTKEFIKRNGEFTVNVALIEGGTPVLGVVYAPAKDILYYGAKNLGAFKVVNNSPAMKVQPAILPVDEVWRIAGSRSHQSEDFSRFIAQFPKTDIVSMGSSLKLCMVADGSAHLYPRLGLTSEWDTGAAQAVVESAGGLVINMETNQSLRYNTKDSLLNPHFIVCSELSPLWHK